MTKILCIESSARSDGLTATLAKECLAGAAEAGAQTEFVQLKDLRLERCRMCDGQGNGTTHCMFQLERLLQAVGAFVLDLVPAAKRNRDYKGQVARLAGAALARLAASGVRPGK